MPRSKRNKITRRHSTMTPTAQAYVAAMSPWPEVSRIVPGVIKPGRRSSGGEIVVVKHESGCLRLTVAGGATVQHVRVFGPDHLTLKHRVLRLALERGASVVDRTL